MQASLLVAGARSISQGVYDEVLVPGYRGMTMQGMRTLLSAERYPSKTMEDPGSSSHHDSSSSCGCADLCDIFDAS